MVDPAAPNGWTLVGYVLDGDAQAFTQLAIAFPPINFQANDFKIGIFNHGLRHTTLIEVESRLVWTRLDTSFMTIHHENDVCCEI